MVSSYRLTADFRRIVGFKMNTTFQKKHDLLVCIDSDGCAMDTMNLKHERCFAPYATEVFQIEDTTRFIQIWHKFNLFSQTRGCNRFKGLVYSLEEYGYQEDFTHLKNWVNNSNELSNRSLQQEIDRNPSPDLLTALKWSEKVNQGIKDLKGQDFPFKNVKRSLEIIKHFADIAVVSSANNEAILDEWQRHQLLPYVDLMYGQNEGSKVACINLAKQYGYQSESIVMIGDSPGDLHSAQQAGVHFYPIIPRTENHSWDIFVLEVLGKLFFNQFTAKDQEYFIAKFNQHLTAS